MNIDSSPDQDVTKKGPMAQETNGAETHVTETFQPSKIENISTFAI